MATWLYREWEMIVANISSSFTVVLNHRMDWSTFTYIDDFLSTAVHHVPHKNYVFPLPASHSFNVGFHRVFFRGYQHTNQIQT